ncbi:succinylglutamate desuccinylase/aspartoacylase domain-containing protein [Crocosphaera sp. Alani8]|uniref:succinylglutamate desuccinylase/aspartoacylase domain-containing protein n=1 Tax=Crocosphaera sp. Alani8 TaxID=3038952 RepID=UPI00313E9343
MNSLSPYGLAMEIGPISQGLLLNDVTSLTEVVVKHGLDYLHLLNEGQQPALPDAIEVFEFQEVVLFPHTREVIMGTIHSSLEGKDYKALHYGEPLFESIDGSVITYDGQETVYPVFIN